MYLTEDVMFKALLEKDKTFEGQFIVGVKTTGIFCRPSCTARKPKKENVEFFDSTKSAMASGYRPCKVCKPLVKSGEVPEEIKVILAEIENNPSEKITDYGLINKGIEPSRVRRWFIKNHGMTFHAYQRLLRINSAFNNIKNGDKVIEAAFENGYDSLSGFGHSFKKATSIKPKDSIVNDCLTYTRLTSPLGPMMAVASEEGICLFDFTDRRMLETELKQIQKHFRSSILPGKSKYFEPLIKQINEYFGGKRKNFDIPLVTPGTEFQNKVWKVLRTIPYGETRSYKKQAIALGNVKAVRAVANANGDNRISILIPCHRVIGEDGKLVGYGGGLWRKQWLLNLEKENFHKNLR
ncbi:MAG TPA: methylated-DNA--[protein]-cysteine S-methyltransferase [Ignavibacteria bacterium]|nr:methylated-DNA--[protein]-cysteine S-methyltransferase [Ignavibacteria bacterium]HMR39433.1 methylated-DNA--[protein]-cysteine S-methyltransferase [Ignavibacteria bacterium]